MSSNPYVTLSDEHFWRRSISAVEKHSVDPMFEASFRISPEDKVATAGSCFAQHLSRALQQDGYNYYVTEAGEELPENERINRNYGVYSARYGNIYTLRQLRQLLDEAFNGATAIDRVWQTANGGFVDPFRPSIEPRGLDSPEDVASSRRVLMKAVREMVQSMDVFVFTLGLTECWRNKADGWVYPIVPGAAGGDFNPDLHEFVNFDIATTMTDLKIAMEMIREINPDIRVVLTISPVPLIATYENRHVLVSTTYSKSVLRVAAGEFAERHDWVEYFPSYEIITGSFNCGSYYEPDFREVRPEGVAHVMRVVRSKLLENAGKGNTALKAASTSSWISRTAPELVCDEEALDEIRPASHQSV